VPAGGSLGLWLLRARRSAALAQFPLSPYTVAVP